ncbi:MAG TPA: hypothetical protein VHC42_09440 [Rhizomicrobium sp.]|nr:hypothetical protein [Rhizomicrobium sp.]
MWSKELDDSIVSDDGKIIYFSTSRFISDIAEGSCCFVCGATPGSKPFNDEHVLPEWVLRRYNLFDRTVGLPNFTSFRYDRYKVPCCGECNSLMGRTIEQPMRSIIDGGHSSLSDYLKSDGPLLPFTWMALIFMKTHLRDRTLSMHLDRRISASAIASAYDWSDLHHVHTICRSFFTKASIAREAFGSMFVLPANCDSGEEEFDFYDLYAAQTLLIRMNDVAMLTVFNDSAAVTNHLLSVTEGIAGPLSSVQLRELLVEAACCNLQLKTRPVFQSAINLAREHAEIIAAIPSNQPEFEPRDFNLRGKMMETVFRDLLTRGQFEGHTREEFLSKVRDGRATFLYDDNGQFIRESLKRKI